MCGNHWFRGIISLGLAVAGMAFGSAPASAQHETSFGRLAVVKTPHAAADGVVTGYEGTTPTQLFSCGSVCASNFPWDEVCVGPRRDICHNEASAIRLVATPLAGWAVGSWTACAGTGACTVQPGPGGSLATTTVTVNFIDPDPPALSLSGPATATLSHAAPWTFSAHATDGTGIQGVEFSINGVHAAGVESGDDYTWTPNPDTLQIDSGHVTVNVKATSVGGQTATASKDYAVDLVAPSIVFEGGPSGPTRDNHVAFTFQMSELGSVKCALDGAALAPCASTGSQSYADVPDGDHVFSVLPTDQFGNVPGAPFTRHFTVDTTPAETTITDGRGDGARTSEPSARFEFASEPGASFECSVDGASPTPCTSPLTLQGLGIGDHTFSVRAADALGNADPTPATRAWTIVADADGDGYDYGLDCDDTNAAIHPGAIDIPDNGVDEDCDTVIAQALDRDGDGYNRPQDCDDANPAINPGARDAPGDAIDDDCDGAPAPWPRLRTQVRIAVEFKGRTSRVVSLSLTDAVRGNAVTLTCRTRGCPFKTKRVTIARDGKVALTSSFKRRWLPAGTQIEVAVRSPAAIGPWVRFVTRVKAVPKRAERCFAPGASGPANC